MRFKIRIGHAKKWFAYAALMLALPYPVLRTWWAVGGTPGLLETGAAGEGFVPWLACIPWLMAAVLSFLLISAPRRIPRRLLLTAGWFATAVVMLIGPGACWTLLTKLVAGEEPGLEVGMASWYLAYFMAAGSFGVSLRCRYRSYQLCCDLNKS